MRQLQAVCLHKLEYELMLQICGCYEILFCIKNSNPLRSHAIIMIPVRFGTLCPGSSSCSCAALSSVLRFLNPHIPEHTS